MRDITNITVTGEDGVVTYADGNKKKLQCSGIVVAIIAGLATTFEKERKMRIIADSRLRRIYTRDSDIISRGLNGTSATPATPTTMNAEFMCLVHVVAPKHDSTLPDADPRVIAPDILHYAPIEAFGAIYPALMSEIQLDQTIDILEQAGDRMKTSNIVPKIISTEGATRNIDTDNTTFWGKKH